MFQARRPFLIVIGRFPIWKMNHGLPDPTTTLFLQMLCKEAGRGLAGQPLLIGEVAGPLTDVILVLEGNNLGVAEADKGRLAG